METQHIDSPITSFYRNKSVFVTGATGFLGKVLVEKLVRSCEVKHIYILLRSKRGKSVERRLEEFIQNDVFSACDPIKLSSTIIALDGDLTQEGLGLSSSDRQKIIDEVSIVFHSAASVRFDDPLKDCLTTNVKATKWVLELCQDIANLEVFVHVSTAYAYCQKPISGEVIYPMQVNVDEMLEASETMDNETFEKMYSKYFEDRPNTYTFTKALAEQYLKNHGKGITIGIARPSIITATWKEPVPGWGDTVNGPSGACLLGSLGIARTMYFKPNCISDLIPADTVVNGLIAIGWYMANTHAGQSHGEKMKVFNLTSGETNPVTWEQFLSYGREAAVESPSLQMLRPPVKVMQGNHVSRFDHLITKYFSELLFAYLIDCILFILGQQRRLVRLVGKMHSGFELLTYFARRQWSFPCDNFNQLSDSLTEEDKLKFNIDISTINWRNYTHRLYLGIRKYLLKEEDSTIPEAKKRMTWIYIGYYLVQFSFLSIIMYIFCKPLFRLFLH